MQLSVEVKRQKGKCVFLCRGSLMQGDASDYLFHLLTRSHRQDVILDLAALSTFDRAGLQTLMLSSNFLVANRRRLFLRHAPSNLLEHIRRRHDAPLDGLYALQDASLVDAVNG
jgi:anti-anti-sigma regulatory factor